jgi:hypothetical protein
MRCWLSNRMMRRFIAIAGMIFLMSGIGLSRPESAPSSSSLTDATAKQSTANPNTVSIHGTFGEKILPLRTEFGMVRVPTQVIAQMSPDADEKRILIILKNRDKITGVPERLAFSVVTKEGPVKIPFFGSGNLGVYVFGSKAGGIDVYPIKSSHPMAPAKGLVVHFTFDGSGNQKILNKPRVTDPATLIRGLHQDGMISFNNKRDHLHLPNHNSFEDINELTLSIWVNLHNYAPKGYANEHGYLVNKGKDLWWNPAWCLGYSKTSGVALFTVGTENGQGRTKCCASGSTKLTPGKWHHLVGTYDGKHASIYVDGRLEKRISYRGKIRRDKAPLLLGGGNLSNTSFGSHFTTNAHIDDFRLYNRALTPGEVTLLHQSPPTHPSAPQVP